MNTFGSPEDAFRLHTVLTSLLGFACERPWDEDSKYQMEYNKGQVRIWMLNWRSLRFGLAELVNWKEYSFPLKADVPSAEPGEPGDLWLVRFINTHIEALKPEGHGRMEPLPLREYAALRDWKHSPEKKSQKLRRAY